MVVLPVRLVNVGHGTKSGKKKASFNKKYKI